VSHELVQFFVVNQLAFQELRDASAPFGVLARAIDSCEGAHCSVEIAEHVERLIEQVRLLPDNCERAECLFELRPLPRMIRGLGTAVGGLTKGGALRRLLRAKDCAVRSVLYKAPA